MRSEIGWQNVKAVVQTWAEQLLAVAMAAVGSSTTLRALRMLGVAPLLIGLAAASSVGLVSISLLLLLRGLDLV